MEIHFYYDIVCPYAFMAFTRIRALAARTGATVSFRPILLGGVLRAVGAPDVPADAMSAPRAQLNLRDILRQAERHGLAVRLPKTHPRRTVEAMRLIHAAPSATRLALTQDLFEAYWLRGEDIADRSVLGSIAARHGVELSRIDASEIKQALRSATEEAVEAGVFGVPTCVVIDGSTTTLFWGADRLHLVERALRGTSAFGGEDGKAVHPLVFFHDFSSPFSYLAATQVPALAARLGVEVTWVPILLGALFKQIGTPNIPIAAMHAKKRAYQRKDLGDWAAWWDVPFTWNEVFPLRTVTALRVAIQEPTLTQALYEAAWAKNLDISRPEVLAGVIASAGFDAESLLEGTQNPSVKGALRDNTQRALEAGACGVPSFQVDGILFWGQDRLDLVEAALTGWRAEVDK